MTNDTQFGLIGDQIKSLDDVPKFAQLGERQQFLNKWYRPVALAPFVIFLIIDFKFFPTSNNWLVVGIGFITLFWAMSIAGYAFYLLTRFKCPRCHKRFGLGESCKSCGLPRHPPGLEDLSTSNLRPLK